MYKIADVNINLYISEFQIMVVYSDFSGSNVVNRVKKNVYDGLFHLLNVIKVFVC